MGTGRLNTKDQGFLHAANHVSSGVPPMSVLESAVLPLVVDSEEKVRNVPG